MIVRDAKKKGLKEVCIGEDDLWFPSENGWKYFLENKPEKYQIYAGCNYIAFQRPEKHGLMKVDCIIGFHLYFIHECYYDQFLATPDDQHIDGAQKGDEMYVIYPFPSLQRPGFSANNRGEPVNYNVILKKEDIYMYESIPHIPGVRQE